MWMRMGEMPRLQLQSEILGLGLGFKGTGESWSYHVKSDYLYWGMEMVTTILLRKGTL